MVLNKTSFVLRLITRQNRHSLIAHNSNNNSTFSHTQKSERKHFEHQN